MKLLLIAGTAILSLLFASADKVGAPVASLDTPWAASVPIHSPK